MNEKEKLEQLEAGRNQVSADQEPNDLPILFPKAEILEIGKKKYSVKPFMLEQQCDMLDLIALFQEQAENPRAQSKFIREACVLISTLIGEEDPKYILRNADMEKLTEIFTTLTIINQKGLTKKKLGS